MKKTFHHNANVIKAILIDHFYEKKRNILFGSEISFGREKRFADLIVVTNNINAYEIKASNDDFRGIRKQLDEYKMVFDYITLVTTENHIITAKNMVKKNEGLIIINNDYTLNYLQKPKQLTRGIKKEILNTIPAAFLKSYFKLPFKIKSVAVRNILEKKTVLELRIVLLEFLKTKLIKKNELFNSERGNKSHFEDVSLLSYSDELEII